MLHVFPSGMPRAIVSLCALEAAAASSISSFCLPLVHCSSSPAANHHTFPISQLSFFLQTHHLHSLTCVCPMHNPPRRPAAPCTEDKRPAEPTQKWGASPSAGSTYRRYERALLPASFLQTKCERYRNLAHPVGFGPLH